MTVQIKIYGKVQGVSFRYCAKQNAIKHKVNGYAKNEADGSVLIEAQGEENDLKRFIEWCRVGSLNATVDGIDVVISENKTIFNSFEIR